MASVTATKTITRRDPKTGKQSGIIKGKVYNTNSKVYRNIINRYPDAFISTSKVTERVSLTVDELRPIVDEYLASYDENGQKKVFDRHVAKVNVQSFRNDRTATTMGVHGQIAYLDRFNDVIHPCFSRAGNTLKSLLLAYNEATGIDRFNV